MNKLANTILLYQSDTFDAGALGVTRAEARKMAAHIFAMVCKIVEESGQVRCDGAILKELLAMVRSA